jgi:hypothetical protein
MRVRFLSIYRCPARNEADGLGSLADEVEWLLERYPAKGVYKKEKRVKRNKETRVLKAKKVPSKQTWKSKELVDSDSDDEGTPPLHDSDSDGGSSSLSSSEED